MKNKDHIRSDFNDWHFQKFGSTPSSGIDNWLYQKLQKQYAYESGYAQALLDLIESMGVPVAHIFPSTINNFGLGERVGEAYSIEVGRFGERSVPVYLLPEDTQK